MESSRTCPWLRGYSRTVLGLGLVDKVLEFTKDTYTSSADALNVQQNCTTNSTNPMKYFGLLTMCHDNNFKAYYTIDSFRYCFLGLLVLTLNSVKCLWF